MFHALVRAFHSSELQKAEKYVGRSERISWKKAKEYLGKAKDYLGKAENILEAHKYLFPCY